MGKRTDFAEIHIEGILSSNKKKKKKKKKCPASSASWAPTASPACANWPSSSPGKCLIAKLLMQKTLKRKTTMFQTLWRTLTRRRRTRRTDSIPPSRLNITEHELQQRRQPILVFKTLAIKTYQFKHYPHEPETFVFSNGPKDILFRLACALRISLCIGQQSRTAAAVSIRTAVINKAS